MQALAFLVLRLRREAQALAFEVHFLTRETHCDKLIVRGSVLKAIVVGNVAAALHENETARYLPLFVTIRVPHVVFPVTFVDVGTNNESREALSPASLTYAASMTADNHLNLPLYRASTVVPSLKGSTLPVAVLVVKPM